MRNTHGDNTYLQRIQCQALFAWIEVISSFEVCARCARSLAQVSLIAFGVLHLLGALHPFGSTQPKSKHGVIDLDEDTTQNPAVTYPNEHGSAVAPQPAAVLIVPGR